MKKKTLIILPILLLIIIIILLSVIITKNINHKDVPTDKNTKSLYHIMYYDKLRVDTYTEAKEQYYDIYIDTNYQVRVALSEKPTSNNAPDNYKAGIKLNENEIKFLDENLKTLNYTYDYEFKTDIKVGNYYIYNYKVNKGYNSENVDINSKINSIIYSIIYEKKEYFKYLENHSLKDYITDNDYKERNIQEDEIKKLYAFSKIDNKIINVSYLYREEKLNNDAIITLALETGEVSYTEQDSKLIFDNNSLDKVIKKYFGNVTYDITTYRQNVQDSETTTGCYGYNYKDSHMEKWYGTGCGLGESIESELIYAYEKEDKLVLIERSLFYDNTINKLSLYDNYKEKNILNHYTEDEQITEFLNQCQNKEIFDLYSNFVTYYSYTFIKNNDHYIFTAFDKLE